METSTIATGTPAAESAFDVSAGELCLDFANTLNGRASGDTPRERLPRYAEVVAWARAAGAIGESEAAALLDRAGRRPEEAAAVHRRALALREAVFRLFVAAAAGEPPTAADLHLLNAELANALLRRRLAPDGTGSFRWTWRSAEELDAVLAPVALSAADLAVSDDLDRVRECAAGTCRWLFLDRSRNRSRRWCDMSACGNRAKARRHYRRRRAEA